MLLLLFFLQDIILLMVYNARVLNVFVEVLIGQHTSQNVLPRYALGSGRTHVRGCDTRVKTSRIND